MFDVIPYTLFTQNVLTCIPVELQKPVKSHQTHPQCNSASYSCYNKDILMWSCGGVLLYRSIDNNDNKILSKQASGHKCRDEITVGRKLDWSTILGHSLIAAF